MPPLMNALGTIFDLLLVVIGFGLIVALHELGHFLAARWAGVRVLAFAVGFGPALFSYRNGLGVQRGSSEAEYNARPEGPRRDALSPTEYRFNAIPFGGYVKMLGQDDADPSARSSAPDSYSSAKVWRRMVIISAGVVMNVLVAAILFIVVFMVGLRTEPAKIGEVAPGTPAATAVAVNAERLGVTEPGLHPGDRVAAIGRRTPNSFNDVVLASAMAARGQTLELTVERPGVPEPLRFRIEPREDRATRMLQLGVAPAASNMLFDVPDDASRAEFARVMQEIGLPGVEPGMTLATVNGRPVESADELTVAVRESGGQPVAATFTGSAGSTVAATVQPLPRLQSEEFLVRKNVVASVSHLLGLTAPMQVAQTQPAAERAGLRADDVFVRIGDVEWPSVPEGMAEIRRHTRGSVPIIVARKAEDGSEKLVDLGPVPVSREGTVGFGVVDTVRTDTLIAAWPKLPRTAGGGAPANETTPEPAASSLRLLPGSRILAVEGRSVGSFHEMRAVLQQATQSAAAAGASAEVTLRIELPLPAADGTRPTEERAWRLSAADVASLQNLGWESPISSWLFEREQFLLQAAGPVGAITMGLEETRRVMMSTYLTFARLIQGTVRVEHLRGPVGIAHVGTLIAERGFVWLMFFLALVSVNLAVINFLPIPIADGGHMVFLIYEQITGRPPAVAVQNAAAMVGLVLIVGLFIIVTFNDISRLISP